MADEQSRKVVIPVVAENQTKSTFQDIKSDAADMAASVEQAGNRAAKGVGGIGDGMDAAAQKFNRGEAAIASALQRYIEKTAIAAKSGESLSNAFSQKIELRGLDAGKFDPLIQKAREAEGALAAVRAQQSQTAGRSAFLDSLTAQTAAIGKSKTELLELQAAQMGVATQAAPLIARMREAEAGVGKVGMSAAATAAAMRNVPAQFTDIVVSLQAGQAPLTVLLQQGGQLKDMFGGVGAAAKAIGSYMLGLVNPYTVAAAAVGVLAYAYYQGSQETENFRKSLLLSGNQAGTSIEQLNSMARAMASTVGTQGKAAAGLAEMAQNSKVGADSLREFTTSAIQWEKATGEAVSETAKRFADLAKDPLKASLALNEQMNFLTASVYSQIKALDEQGKKEEAAAVAQKAYSDALKSRSNEAVQNIGWVERAYKAAGNAATWAWDRIAGIGRPETQQSAAELKMAELEKRIADRQKRAQEDGDSGGAWAKGTEKLKLQLAAMKELNGQLSSVDAFIANMATANKDYIDSTQALDEIAGQFAKKDVKRKQELTVAQNAYNTAVEKTKKLYADSPELQGMLAAQKAKYDQAVAGINERYKDPKGRSSGGVKISDNQVAGLEAQLVAAKQYAEQLRLVGAAASEANVGERESLKLSELMEKATDGKTRAKLAEAKAIADALGVQLRSNDGLEKSLKAHQALIDGNYKDADAISQRAKAQQAANAVYGQGRTEIERMTLATMEHQLAEAEGSDSFDPKYIASLKEKIKAQKEWVGALDAYDYKKLDDQLTKSLEASKQELAIQQQGLSMLGMEESQRKIIIAQRKIELDVAKKIAEVEKQYKGRTDEDALREAETAKRKIQEQGTIDTQIAIGQIQEEYALKNAEKYNDIFRQGFADFVNNGTAGLKAFGKSLKTTVLTSISDALYRAFAQKFVMNITASITGLLGGGAGLLASLFGGDGSSGGGAGNLLSAGSTGYSLYSGEGLVGQGSRYLANMFGWGGEVAPAAGYAAPAGAGIAEGGAAIPEASWASSASEWVASGGWVMAVPLIAAYLGGMFKEEKQVGSGITGELGGDLYGYQLMRESGSLFGGPKYRYLVAEKEIEQSKAEIERLKKEIADNPDDKRNAYRERQIQQQYSRLEMLSQYNGSIEGSKGPIKVLQDAFMGIREDTASRADSLGLDGDAIRAMKVTLGLDEIHPDTGGKGLELTGLTQEEATAKVQQALAQANEELARSVLGKWETQTREVTRMVWDNVELPSDGDTQQYGRVGREVTETVTEQVFVMSEYVRAGETAVQALTRLSDSLYSVNSVFDMLGVTLMDTSLAGADLASDIIDAFGGADKFSAATGNYYDKFYTDQEKVKNQTRLLNDQLKKLGIETMPASREALREYINGIDLSTEEGRKLYASLLGLVDVFDMIYTSAENIASLKQDLNLQLLRAQGNDAEAQRLEREKQIKELEKYNDPELVRMQREVWAAEDKKKAEEEAKQALESAKSLAMNNLQAAIGREKEHWNTFAKTAQEKLTQAASYFDMFTGAAKSLRGSVEDVATYQAAAGMVYIEQALANARRGLGLGDYDQAKTAVEAASSGLVMDNYATQAELDYDKKVLAAQLEELGEFAGVAKTDAQKQIDLANAQIKRLDETLSYWQNYGQDQIDATLSVTDAVNALFKLLDPKEQERIKQEEAAKAGLGGGSTTPSHTPSGGGSLGGYMTGSNRVTVVGLTADGRAIFSNGEVGKTPAGQTTYNSTGQMNSNGYSLAEFERFKTSGEFEWVPEKNEWRKRASFAVGTNYVPYDMTANIHQGERIIPVADNRAIISALQSRGSDSSQLSQVVAELKSVKAELQAMKGGQGELVDQSKKLGRLFSNVTDGGDAMRSRAVA